jgi:glutaredoxin 3
MHDTTILSIVSSPDVMYTGTMSTTTTKPIIYSATWCGFCHAAKQYMDKLGVAYDDRDVDSNPDFASESVEKSGQRGIPVIDIDGEIIVGFDRPKIDSILKAKKLV